jgi:hypothetical protein
MSCEVLHNGLELACSNVVKNYYQQAILINRQDILNKKILTTTTSIAGIYQCRHKIIFNLKENLSGFRFSSAENGTSIFGVVEKSLQNGIPQYKHAVTIVVLGVNEMTKCTLKQLDYADYFVALQLYNGIVEIFGFEYGLTTDNYSYDSQNAQGGAILKLVSQNDALEDELPFIYSGGKYDFDNLFQDVPFRILGDFNNDFSNSFSNF